MPDFLPELLRLTAPTQPARRLARFERQLGAGLARRQVVAATEVELDRIDSVALNRVISTATAEEFAFFDDAMAAADGSAVKLELLARKLQLFSQINNHRIAQRFGS